MSKYTTKVNCSPKGVSTSSPHRKTVCDSAVNRTEPDEQLYEDITQCFRDLPAFSFVLMCDHECAVGPTLASAVELVCHAYGHSGYSGPYPESQFAEAKAEAARRHMEIIGVAKEWVRRVCRSGVPFVLCWQAYGEEKPHIVFSDDYDDWEARNWLLGIVHDEIECRMPV